MPASCCTTSVQSAIGYGANTYKVIRLCKTEKTESKNNMKYRGLEHRQTLRACDFLCDLQIEIEN